MGNFPTFQCSLIVFPTDNQMLLVYLLVAQQNAAFEPTGPLLSPILPSVLACTSLFRSEDNILQLLLSLQRLLKLCCTLEFVHLLFLVTAMSLPCSILLLTLFIQAIEWIMTPGTSHFYVPFSHQ